MSVTLFDILIKKTNNTHLQFLRYIGVGGVAAIVNIGTLVLFKEVFVFHYLLANIAGFCTGLITNFVLSRLFVFTDNASIGKAPEFIAHGLISLIGLGFDSLFIWYFTDLLGFYYIHSKVVSTAIVFIWNFIGRKMFYHINGKTHKETHE
jgi:putative flippase GtrA